MSPFIKISVGLAVIILTGFVLQFTNTFSLIKEFLQPQNLEALLNQFGVFAPLVFIALYYGLVLAFVSAAAFTILAGLLFGKVWGSVYVIIAATLAAQTAFFITRQLGSEKLEVLKNKKGIGTLIHKIEAQTQSHGFKSIFLLRCLFAPYIPLSYAAGMIKTLKARDFFFATFFTNLIFTPAFVFLGDSLLDGPKALILPFILVLLVLSVPKILKKLKPEAHV